MSNMKSLGTKATAAAALTILLITGCSGGKPQATYETVAELKDAFVAAGGDCADWDESNKVEIAAQSGACGGSTVLSVYLSSDAVERRIETTKASIFGSTGSDWLVGENWIINTKDAASFSDKLGGRIVSFASK